MRVHSGATGDYLYTIVSPNEPFVQHQFALAGVRDLDGDGAGEILIGAEYERVNREVTGRAYVFSGATGALLFQFDSPNAEDKGQFGSAITTVPDVNRDRIDEILVGARGKSTSLRHADRAYLFSGADGALLRTLTSPTPAVQGDFDAKIAGLKDVNGDRRGDLAIAAPVEDSAGAQRAGRVHVFSGRNGRLLYSLASPNEQVDGAFGAGVARVADLDHDRRDDLVVSTAFEEPPGSPTNAGRAYVYSGVSGTLLYTLVSPNEESGGLFGNDVSGVEDADGDGQGDVLVGAYYEGEGTPGRAYLFFGKSEGRLERCEPVTLPIERRNRCGCRSPKPSDFFSATRSANCSSYFQKHRDAVPSSRDCR